MKKTILFILLYLFPMLISAQNELYIKAKNAFEVEDYELSIKYLNELISKPYEENEEYDEVDLYVYLALANKRNGDDKAFTDILSKTIDKYPDNEYAISTYAAIRIEEDNYDDIIKFMDNLSVKHPKYKAKYLFMKARVVMKKNDNFKTAEPIYEQVLKLDPNNSFAIMDIGAFSMQYADKLREEEEISDSNKKDQHRDEIIHYYKQAAEYLKKAYEVSEDGLDKDAALDFLEITGYRLQELNIDISKYKIDVE